MYVIKTGLNFRTFSTIALDALRISSLKKYVGENDLFMSIYQYKIKIIYPSSHIITGKIPKVRLPETGTIPRTE